MLTKMRVQNFQTHEDTVIEFDPGITTIVGANDEGKSALLRALRWVMLNQPRGSESFIRWGEDFVTVTLDLDDTQIERTRKGNSNLYRVGEEEFKAFGLKVPSPVEAVTKVWDLNFQGQFDVPFWIGESDAEVSRQLNLIADLAIVDRSMKASRQVRDRLQSAVTETVRRIEQNEKELESLRWTEDAKKEWDEADAVRTKGDVLRSKVDDLTGILEETKRIAEERNRLLEFRADAEDLLKRWERNRAREKTLAELQAISDEMEELLLVLIFGKPEKLDEETALLEKSKRLRNEAEKMEMVLQEIGTQVGIIRKGAPDPDELDEIGELLQRSGFLRLRASDLESRTEEYLEGRKALSTKRCELESIIAELDEGADVCPTCGADVDIEKVLGKGPS